MATRESLISGHKSILRQRASRRRSPPRSVSRTPRRTASARVAAQALSHDGRYAPRTLQLPATQLAEQQSVFAVQGWWSALQELQLTP
jgi:hypothetical protein